MTARIEPGMWVRWLRCPDDAPLAGWRQLDFVGESGFRLMKVLVFTDGYQVPMHVANLSLTDEHGLKLWETSETKPAEVDA